MKGDIDSDGRKPVAGEVENRVILVLRASPSAGEPLSTPDGRKEGGPRLCRRPGNGFPAPAAVGGRRGTWASVSASFDIGDPATSGMPARLPVRSGFPRIPLEEGVGGQGNAANGL